MQTVDARGPKVCVAKMPGNRKADGYMVYLIVPAGFDTEVRKVRENLTQLQAYRFALELAQRPADIAITWNSLSAPGGSR